MSRVLSVVGVAALALVAAPRAAAAQHCHVDVPEGHKDHVAHAHHGEAAPAVRAWWLGASSSLVIGSGEVLGEARDYEGLALAITGGWSRLSGRVALPAYRIADEGVGLGDALLALAADATPGRDGPVRAGISGSLSLPTGDSDAGRGMGHPMIAAGVWARAPLGPVRADVVAVYARALGDGAEHAAHAHAAAMWPLVDPMNPEELAVDARGTAGVGRGLRAGAGATYAAPLSAGGETRAIAYAVAELARGRYTFSSQLAVPVAGDPFVARGTFGLAYRH